MQAVLVVDGVGYRYGKTQALDAVSFSIAMAEFTVLLGPNGAGKTTLFSLITGLYHSRQGQISICGYAMHKNPSQALLHLGVVFQQRSLDMDLSVCQNLKYSAYLYGLSSKEGMRRATKELERIGMTDKVDTKVRYLSGGQVRRVEIARALINRPKLLVLDEPTVGLDVQSRELIVSHVRKLCSEGLAVLWTTHLLDEVHADDKLMILKQGKVTLRGRAAQLTATRQPTEMKRKLADLL